MQEGHCHKSTNIVTKMYRISKPSKRKEIVELELGDRVFAEVVKGMAV
jgi:hypothetical protein